MLESRTRVSRHESRATLGTCLSFGMAMFRQLFKQETECHRGGGRQVDSGSNADESGLLRVCSQENTLNTWIFGSKC